MQPGLCSSEVRCKLAYSERAHEVDDLLESRFPPKSEHPSLAGDEDSHRIEKGVKRAADHLREALSIVERLSFQ